MVLLITIIIEVVFATVIGGDPAIVERSLILTILAGILSVIFSLSGPLSFIIVVFALAKYKDWPALKSLAILYGLTLLMFLLGEFLFPH